MKYISVGQVIFLHDALIDRYGGAHGLRDSEGEEFILGLANGEVSFKQIVEFFKNHEK